MTLSLSFRLCNSIDCSGYLFRIRIQKTTLATLTEKEKETIHSPVNPLPTLLAIPIWSFPPSPCNWPTALLLNSVNWDPTTSHRPRPDPWWLVTSSSAAVAILQSPAVVRAREKWRRKSEKQEEDVILKWRISLYSEDLRLPSWLRKKKMLYWLVYIIEYAYIYI